METDVIVIGAGLAGLQCARRVQRSGYTVTVLEAGDAVGGRVRTDTINGFQCDRGFQLLNPAYPAVRSWIDTDSLELQKFGVGVVVRSGESTTTLAHPLKHPRHAFQTLSSELTPASDLLALVRWITPAFIRPGHLALDEDQSLRESFDRAGLTGRLRRDVLDTFLAGVLASSSGESSAHHVRELMRYFVLGVPGLPRAGMQALPEQMATWLAHPVRLNTAVQEVQETSHGVRVVTGQEEIRGRAAVIAVGPQDLPTLTKLPAPATRGLSTWWFRAPSELPRSPFLMLDATRLGGGPAGPIWHTAVVSDVAPSYAPPGEKLVQATTLLDRPDGLADEAQVRHDLARLYQTSTKDWEVLTHHVVRHALPAQLPPLQKRSPLWTGDRILLAGDHRQTASIQGALLSGDRSAREVVGLLNK